MKIIIASRALFIEYLTRKGITNENVETQDKVFFISINNQDDKQPPYFSGNKTNVMNLTFADLEEDKELPIIGEERTELFKAMTREQAAELYAFIKANKDKEAVMIHCTAGVARSGAVGVFINDFIGGDYNELKRNNPNIQPNSHVYRLLHDQWYKDIAHNDAVTGEPIDGFKLEVLNPKPVELLVAEYNYRNPDQHTVVRDMTLEEIQKQYPDANVSRVERQGISGVEYKVTSEDSYRGMHFKHPDGSSTYIAGIDPFRNDPEFENFWLETDKYYGMVTEDELNVVGHLHHLQEILPARKKMLPPGEFEAFPEFGFGEEYNGIDLRTWISLKNMNSFFKWFGSGTIFTGKYATEDKNYGIDGTYFEIPLDKEFKHLDVLTNGHTNCPQIIVTDVPVRYVAKEDSDIGEEYWVHTVQLFTNKTGQFISRKFLLPGTRYYKM